MDTMDVVVPRRARRTHGEAFKRSVISACREPCTSDAGLALANGLNANEVHRSMRERGIVQLTSVPVRRIAIADEARKGVRDRRG
ncbi:MAG: hypothetical protein JSS47_15570 [Proteobacteria bacterium]|nr:hypothetical protein [Pseudomonadota bacterium]